jgi:hypothetical protein
MPAPTVTLSGTLPAKLRYAGASIVGVPTTTGTHDVTVTASNGIGPVVLQTLAITVVPLSITTTTLPGAKVGAHYQQALAVADEPHVKWTITGGALPRGLRLTETGIILGVPTANASEGSFQVTAETYGGANSQRASASFTITVAPR